MKSFFSISKISDKARCDIRSMISFSDSFVYFYSNIFSFERSYNKVFELSFIDEFIKIHIKSFDPLEKIVRGLSCSDIGRYTDEIRKKFRIFCNQLCVGFGNLFSLFMSFFRKSCLIIYTYSSKKIF